jgi:hypothetical protein
MALAISQAENGTRQCDRVAGPNKNGTYDYGLFMINEVHLKKGYTIAQLKDCNFNIKVAKAIFDRQGWNPWSTLKNGSYKKFLR